MAKVEAQPQPRPWLIYTRVSTEDQAREGVSLDAQQGACESMARALSLPVAQVLTDPGVSAKDLQRPGVQAALAAIEAGTAAGVIVYKLDRLTRSRRDLEDLLERFQRAGAGLISVSEKLDTSSPMGRFFVAMLGAIAQWERETIAERVQMGMDHRRAQGGFVGGPVPVGLRLVAAEGGGKRLELDPAVGPKLAEAWKLVLQGQSLRQVADHLAAAGIAPALRWSPASVRKVLLNGRYVGRLVSEEEHRQVIETLASRFSPHRGNGRSLASVTHANRVWLLSGIGRCAACGAALIGTTSLNGSRRAYHYYRCGTRERQGPRACAAKDLPAEPWEVAVVDALARSIEQDGRLPGALQKLASSLQQQAGPLADRLRDIGLEIDRQRRERDNLVQMAAQGGLAAQALAKPLADRQQAINDLERSRAEVEGQLAGVDLTGRRLDDVLHALGEGIAALPALPPEDQREALLVLVESVTLRAVSKEAGEINLSVNLPRIQATREFGRLCPMVEHRSLRPHGVVAWEQPVALLRR